MTSGLRGAPVGVKVHVTNRLLDAEDLRVGVDDVDESGSVRVQSGRGISVFESRTSWIQTFKIEIQLTLLSLVDNQSNQVHSPCTACSQN